MRKPGRARAGTKFFCAVFLPVDGQGSRDVQGSPHPSACLPLATWGRALVAAACSRTCADPLGRMQWRSLRLQSKAGVTLPLHCVSATNNAAKIGQSQMAHGHLACRVVDHGGQRLLPLLQATQRPDIHLRTIAGPVGVTVFNSTALIHPAQCG